MRPVMLGASLLALGLAAPAMAHAETACADLAKTALPHAQVLKAVEDKVRSFCAACLDPFVGADRFDFVRDLGAELPMRAIGMLVGIEVIEAMPRSPSDLDEPGAEAPPPSVVRRA